MKSSGHDDSLGVDLTTQTTKNLGRRAVLWAGGGLAAAMLASGLAPAPARAETSKRTRSLRIAYLTDIHVQPEMRAGEGMAACLRHVQALPDRPDLILSGGDQVMDCYRQTRDRTRVLWDLWTAVLKAENSIPVRACIGNHDIWGWDKTKSGASGAEPDYGKKWACDVLGLATPYSSFSQAGWHIIALDGVQPGAKEGTFSGYLDAEQFDWLRRELESVPATTPVMIWSHIPILSALPPLMYARASRDAGAFINSGNLHTDAVAVLALLGRHPNVKLCLSGHLHLIDHVEYKGVHFYCNGAVSGSWWAGPNGGFDEGYTLLDLYDDGSHEHHYVPFGWKASKP